MPLVLVTGQQGQQAGPAAIVLGIESSCDDTGVAVVTSDGRVLGEALATQAEIHAQWGEQLRGTVHAGAGVCRPRVHPHDSIVMQ